MNVLVTGATGFVGSHFCEWLEQRGHAVWGLYRSPEKRLAMGQLGVGIQGSLSTDVEQPNAWLGELPDPLDAVVHVAGQTMSFRTAEFHAVNERATRRLLLDLRERIDSPLRFTLVSSLAAAGPNLDERPVSEYGKSKLAAERAVVELAPDSWQLGIVRPPIVIGPRDPGMLDLFKTIANRVLPLPGLLGRFKRYSFVGVGDLCDALGGCVVQELPARPSVYFSAHPRTMTLLELGKTIRHHMGISWSLRAPVPMPILWGVSRLGKLLHHCGVNAIPLTPDKVREARQKGWVCCGERAARELNFEYREDLEDIVARTYADYRARGWL